MPISSRVLASRLRPFCSLAQRAQFRCEWHLHRHVWAPVHLRRVGDGPRAECPSRHRDDRCRAGDEVLLHRRDARRHAAKYGNRYTGNVSAHRPLGNGAHCHEQQRASAGADAEPAVWKRAVVGRDDADVAQSLRRD